MKEIPMRVDAQHHFWDPTRATYPWMVGEALDPVRRPFTPDDLAPGARRSAHLRNRPRADDLERRRDPWVPRARLTHGFRLGRRRVGRPDVPPTPPTPRSPHC